MINLPTVFRFAPSPNGYLHLGHAYSALLNYEMAKSAGGRFLLRMEDIDQTRCSPELEKAMLDDLAWLGLKWETPIRKQSLHFDDYAQALQKLDALGLTYRSKLSRGDIKRIVASYEERGGKWPRDPDGAPLFPGKGFEHEADPSNKNFAIRLDTKAAMAHCAVECGWRETGFGPHQSRMTFDPEKWGDVVLARRDVPTSYHLSVVVDDSLQGVTHVVRGRDLLEATAIHVLLQKLLELPELIYHHHSLVLDDNGRKLSKSDKDTSLLQLRQAGATPNEIRQMVGL